MCQIFSISGIYRCVDASIMQDLTWNRRIHYICHNDVIKCGQRWQSYCRLVLKDPIWQVLRSNTQMEPALQLVLYHAFYMANACQHFKGGIRLILDVELDLSEGSLQAVHRYNNFFHLCNSLTHQESCYLLLFFNYLPFINTKLMRMSLSFNISPYADACEYI